MGQIVKGKKKGRPSKADLARRAAAAGPSAAVEEESDVRRRLRRRNVRYNFDFDDYAEDEVYNEEEERRREKKMKVLLKLQGERAGYKSTPSMTQLAPDVPSSPSDSEDGTRPLKKKKKKIDTVGDVEEDDDEDVENEIGEDTEVRERKAGRSDADSVPGTPSDPLRTPLPDQKTLELILDKLQKKDTYGVFAEPVDPEELPDYHDVIEHPMDFATVRKKLGKGSYSALEQLESDILLICSNAMQYNAPDTIYYKQAFAIQELAKRKFQRFKSGLEHYEKEPPSDEQRERPNSLANKQIKKSATRITQEIIASDFSSGATLATLGDSHPGSTTTKARGLERLSNVDEYVDGIATPGDNNLDKPDDLLTGRSLLGRFGRKPLINDDNRRATYDMSTQPVSQAKSLFTIFDGEIKQLVAVGLHVDHSYARSLARFAAMLGPVAWNVASKRIEQALPPGFKFGRGWVGEYEPVLTPVLNTQKCSRGDIFLHRESNPISVASKGDESFKPGQYVVKTTESMHKRQSNMPDAAVDTTVSPTSSCPPPSKLESLRKENSEVKPIVAASVSYPAQSPRAKNSQAERKVKKRVELNSPSPSANQSPHEFSAENQTSNGINTPTSKLKEPLSQSMNLPVSLPLKRPEDNGLVEVPNGKSLSNSFDINRTVTPTPVSNSNARGKPASYFPHGQQQGLTDPVQLMMRLTENAQKQQKPSNHSAVDNSSVPLSKKEDLSNASSAAARAWMSIGTGVPKSVSVNTNDCNNQMFVNSLRSPTQVSRFRNDFPVSGMQFHPMNNNFPVQAFMAPHLRTGNEAQYQNRPQMVFPHLVTADLSRFQMQAPRQGQLLQRQPSHKQETTVPPDLNIVFQSSGSPGRQSSGVQVDPQQPDLALQL